MLALMLLGIECYILYKVWDWARNSKITPELSRLNRYQLFTIAVLATVIFDVVG